MCLYFIIIVYIIVDFYLSVICQLLSQYWISTLRFTLLVTDTPQKMRPDKALAFLWPDAMLIHPIVHKDIPDLSV